MQKKVKLIIGIVIIVLIIGTIIGYAVFKNQDQNIYEIRFTNIDIIDGSVAAIEPCRINAKDTTVSFKVELEEKSDYYACGLFVRNYGNIDGTIEEITSTYNDTDLLDLEIFYEDGTPVQIGDILLKDSTQYITFKIKWKDSVNVDEIKDEKVEATSTIYYKY